MSRGQGGAADNKQTILLRMPAMFSCSHVLRIVVDNVRNVDHLEGGRDGRYVTEEHNALEGEEVGDGRHSVDQIWIHKRHDVCLVV